MPQIAETVRAFLEEVRFAVIATTNRDGSPHQAALWYELRGETIVMNTGAQSRKVLNLKRDPRASVTIVDSTQARHVTLEGTVSLDDRHVQEDLTALASRYLGAEAGPGIATNIARIPHVSLVLSVARVKTFGNI